MKKKILIVGVIIVVIIIIGLVIIGTTGEKLISSSKNKFSNLQPMFGATTYEEYVVNRKPSIQKIDDKFVNEVVAKKGSVGKALSDTVSLAWDYIGKKDTDTAMKRCNQAWLIDHTNFNVYWCYAAVLGSKNDFEQSANYFEKAISMYSKDSEFFANDYLPLYKDASFTFINLSDKYLSTDQVSAKKYAAKAVDLLSKSLKDKNLPKEIVPKEMVMLAYANFNNGSYKEARAIYTSATTKYPEILKTPDSSEFDKALKEKGF